jgi:hypothetical protein
VACTGKIPKWDGEFWAASHTEQAVIIQHAGQPTQKISCSDPKFSEGVWLTYDSLGCLYQQLIMNCSQWKSETPECKPVPKQMVQDFLKGM